MQTVSLLFCIMIAVATADDAAAAADRAAAADAAGAAGAADAGAARAADADAAGAAAARAADADAAGAAGAGAARSADADAAGAAGAGAARSADAGAAGAARAADADAAFTGAARAASCRSGWEEFEGRCFQYVPRALTWATAEKNCKNLKSHLASVHNHHEYQFIQDMIKKNTQATAETWIGGSDCQQKDNWLWSDGSIFFWTFWCAGQRDSSGCLQMNHGGENCWHEDQCSSKLPSVCAHNL